MAVLFPVETSQQHVFITWVVLFTALATTAVGLRLLSRRISNRKLASDDFLMVASCLFLVAYMLVSVLAVVVGGMGYHLDDLKQRFGVALPAEKFIKFLVGMQIMWCVNLTLTKCAILALYIKIFTMPSFVLAAKATMILTLTCTTIMVVGSVAVCQPMAYFWDKTIEGGMCGDYPAIWVTTAAISIVTDLATLVLPIPHVWKLELERSKKAVLICTFSLGALTCIAGAVYISRIATYDPADSTFSALPMILVAFVEPAAGITLGCLPVLRPLWKRNRTSITVQPSKSVGSSKSAGSSQSRLHHDFEAEQEPRAITVKTSWYVQHGTGSKLSFVPK